MTRVPEAVRPLARGTLITAIGNGAWYASWALFLTGPVGLSAGAAGLAMSLAGAAGVAAATPVGQLADRFGAREVLVALLIVQAVGTLGFLAVGGLASLIAVACVTTAASASAGGVRQALVARVTESERRLAALASLRVVSHVGWSIGAVIGAVVIQVGTPAAFAAVIVLNALTYVGYAVVVVRLPRVPVTVAEPGESMLPALRDVPYVTLAGICGVLALCWSMLSSALPLWVATHTQAPRAASGFVIVLSCVGIAALQVRVTRGARDPLSAARAAMAAAACLALACGLFAVASGPGPVVATALIVAGGVAHVAGELLFVAGSWGLSVPLMRDDLPGQYQGVFATGEAGAQLAGPALMTSVVVTGPGGWALLAALFVGATLPVRLVTRWALRTRVVGAGT